MTISRSLELPPIQPDAPEWFRTFIFQYYARVTSQLNLLQSQLGSAGRNSSVVGVAAGYAADTYLTGSNIKIPSGSWRAGMQYRLLFDMVKTAAGVATPIIQVRMGLLGTTADASILTLTFAAGTAAVDTGIFEVLVNFRTVGPVATAVIQGVAQCTHHLAATGLTTTGAAGVAIIIGTSAGFNSTTQTTIGVSFNGGAAFAGTNTLVQAELFGI